jgi:FSR family fosmidomycin resistance protein-like MFS transporter
MKVHRSVLALGAAHFFIDIYSTALGSLLPFLHRELNLSLSQAGLLGGILSLSSSFAQPLYGYLSDRMRHKVFSALSPAIAAVFISCVGLADGFWTVAVLLLLGGVGVAAFHPQAASVTQESSADDHGYQMSFFITAGMIGYALGPVYMTTVVALAGLRRSYWAAIPGILISVYLLWRGPAPARREPGTESPRLARSLQEHWKPLLVLYVLVVLRSAVQMVFVSFYPLYLTTRGMTEAQSSQVLTVFLLTGGTAGFLGGMLADRFGGRIIIAISMIGAFPFLIGCLWARGPWLILAAAGGGAFILFTTAVNVVMAQRLVPHGSSTVSALMMGFAWGMGGLATPLTGIASEIFGMQAAMAAVAALTVPGFLLSLALPREGRIRPDQIRAVSSVEVISK